MAKTQDLVVKMTINSNDFARGLTNAKASMNKFNGEVGMASKAFKTAIGGMTKAFGALGIAVDGAQIFKSFINSTQTMGDAWNNTMVAAKTSFQVFETAVASGTGTILSNFRESIRAAREFAEAMDAFGSAQISNQYARMEYVTPFNEAMTRYREAKATGDTTGMAYAHQDMLTNFNLYSANADKLKESARESVLKAMETYTGGFINSGNLKEYLNTLYLEIVNGVLPPILQDFQNLEVERKKGDYFYNKAKEAMDERYGEGWRREAEALNVLANINDDTLKEMLGILQTYDQVRNEINSMRKRMNSVLKGETSTTPTTPTVTTPSGGTAATSMTPDQVARYWFNDRTPPPLIDIPVEDEEIVEPELDALMEAVAAAQERMKQLAAETQLAFTAANALAGAFGAFGDMSDSTLGKVAKGLGSVISQIVATVQAMMALAGAEVVEGVVDVFANENGDVWKKLAVSAVALAGILGIVASAKSAFAGSFAEGGIVGGSSYTGDRLWARVNSGEMILNQQQQASLLNQGGQVRFVIEGSQLKGVLENYETIQNL